ncbi:MAG: phosphoribosylformylglycinamidine synthase II, partial [Bacteroidetes bacterium]|nr:phosphoribosylformylglycinamidine synthase II [Bacteroidota bacterium]
AGFRSEGDRIILLGQSRNEINGSEYLSSWHGILGGDAPTIDLEEEHALHRLLLTLIRNGQVHSAHDVSDGGFAVSLAECCFLGQEHIGATVELPVGDFRRDALYFGESQSRVLISCSPDNAATILAHATEAGVAAIDIGVTGGSHLRINGDVDIEIERLADAHSNALEELLEKV